MCLSTPLLCDIFISVNGYLFADLCYYNMLLSFEMFTPFVLFLLCIYALQYKMCVLSIISSCLSKLFVFAGLHLMPNRN